MICQDSYIQNQIDEIVAEINSIGLKFTVGAEVNKKVTIKIASKKCPFAVQIVKGKEFE